jgi:hypothetical protein
MGQTDDKDKMLNNVWMEFIEKMENDPETYAKTSREIFNAGYPIWHTERPWDIPKKEFYTEYFPDEAEHISNEAYEYARSRIRYSSTPRDHDNPFTHKGTTVNPEPAEGWTHVKTRRLGKQVEGLRFIDPNTQLLWNVTFDYPLCYLHRINEDGTGQLDRIKRCSTKEEMGLMKARLEYVLRASGTHWKNWHRT